MAKPLADLAENRYRRRRLLISEMPGMNLLHLPTLSDSHFLNTNVQRAAKVTLMETDERNHEQSWSLACRMRCCDPTDPRIRNASCSDRCRSEEEGWAHRTEFWSSRMIPRCAKCCARRSKVRATTSSRAITRSHHLTFSSCDRRWSFST